MKPMVIYCKKNALSKTIAAKEHDVLEKLRNVLKDYHKIVNHAPGFKSESKDKRKKKRNKDEENLKKLKTLGYL